MPAEEFQRKPTRPILDPWVFGITAAMVIGFVAWGLADQVGHRTSLQRSSQNLLDWITSNLGWLFVLSATGFVLFTLFLAISKYGRIPLGKDGDQPEYRTISWIAMMFSAGMGIGLMFYGAFEPLTHYVVKPPGVSGDAVREAMATTMFHWGFHPWAMYAVVGLAIAYGTYRCGRSQLVSAIFQPFLGPRASTSVGGRIIDILAIFATLFGTVASLGLGAVQIGAGLEKVGWVNEVGTFWLAVIIGVLTFAFVASAVSGIAKGIQWLSNINMVLAIILAVFVFVVGPTVFILNLIPTSLGAYLNDITSYSARSSATIGDTIVRHKANGTPVTGDDWLASWTIFYWAWWVSWTPFVGMFLAKISKGRTIREFVVGVMIVPTTVSLVWFAIFGGTAIRQQQGGGLSFNPDTTASSDTLFDTLANLPWTAIASALVMILVAIFFVSGADSASLVMATLSERGAEEPKRSTTIFWGVLTGTVAAVLLAVGGSGDSVLTGIQNMAIIAALPFVIVMIGICVSVYIELRRDPLIVSQRILRHQVNKHIKEQAEAITTGEFAAADHEVAKHVEGARSSTPSE